MSQWLWILYVKCCIWYCQRVPYGDWHSHFMNRRYYMDITYHFSFAFFFILTFKLIYTLICSDKLPIIFHSCYLRINWVVLVWLPSIFGTRADLGIVIYSKCTPCPNRCKLWSDNTLKMWTTCPTLKWNSPCLLRQISPIPYNWLTFINLIHISISLLSKSYLIF